MATLLSTCHSSCCSYSYTSHDDVIKWKHFQRYWPFVRGIHRWIPRPKASDAELWRFLWSAPEQAIELTIETPVIWDASRSLWRHCNATVAVYLIEYVHGFVVLCLLWLNCGFREELCYVFTRILWDCFVGSGAIVRLPRCQWKNPEGHG